VHVVVLFNALLVEQSVVIGACVYLFECVCVCLSSVCVFTHTHTHTHTHT
jgi:hypothetical protein